MDTNTYFCVAFLRAFVIKNCIGVPHAHQRITTNRGQAVAGHKYALQEQQREALGFC